MIFNSCSKKWKFGQWTRSKRTWTGICDAFLAATTDYLSRVNHVQTPAWALKEDLILDEPWFSLEDLGIRLRLLRDTPSAFKDKNIFIFDRSEERRVGKECRS